MLVLWTAGPLLRVFLLRLQFFIVWTNSFPECIWWKDLNLFPKGTGFLKWIFLIALSRISGACIKRMSCHIPVHSKWEKEPGAASTCPPENSPSCAYSMAGWRTPWHRWCRRRTDYCILDQEKHNIQEDVLFFYFCHLFEHHSLQSLPCIPLLFLIIRVALKKPLCSVPLGGVWYKLKKIKLWWQHNSMSCHCTALCMDTRLQPFPAVWPLCHPGHFLSQWPKAWVLL